jgi:UDP-N-acetylmuramoyl-tripeptide--D-alanyl-D-alanine ligase
MRMERMSVGGVIVINDTYNANPTSMKFGLDTLASVKADGRKIAVLGDMLELGDWAEDLHREVGAYVAAVPPDSLVTSGDLAGRIATGASEEGYPPDKINQLADVDGVIDFLLRYLRPGDVVLIKASRSMAFDRITLGLRSRLGRDN